MTLATDSVPAVSTRAALDAHRASAQVSELGHQLRALLAKPPAVTSMDVAIPG